MAKQYIIKLSPKEVTRDIVIEACPTCGNPGKEDVEPLSVLEKSILKQLFEIASSSKRKISDTMLCYDCIHQVDNLKDEELELELTETDIKFLEEGFEATAGFHQNGIAKRPPGWMKRCYKLFEQIKNPKTREEWDKK